MYKKIITFLFTAFFIFFSTFLFSQDNRVSPNSRSTSQILQLDTVDTDRIVIIDTLDQEIVETDTLAVNKNKKNNPNYAKLKVDSIGIYGHDFLRTTNFPLYRTLGDVKVTDDYILGPGDEISVSLWDKSDYKNDTFRLSEDGKIYAENWGVLNLNGLTLGNARQLLKNKYDQFYRFDVQDFSVSLTGSRMISVSVVGEVVQPGTFQVLALNTAFNVLKLAGGPTSKGTVRSIQIRRENQVIETIDVYDFLNNIGSNPDIYLKDKDVIVVGKIEKLVEIRGEIRKPDRYELTPTERLNDLLGYAGGFLPTAIKDNIKIYRYQDNKLQLRDINYDITNPAQTNAEIFLGDSLVINKIPREIDNFVSISGAVVLPGKYEFYDGITAADLLQRASGFRFDAVRTKAYIIRLTKDFQYVNLSIDLEDAISNKDSDINVQLMPKDSLLVLSKADFATDYEVEIFGFVKKPGKYKFASEMTLYDLLILAGGFKTEAMNTQIELHRVVDYDREDNQVIPITDIIERIDVDYDFMSPENDQGEINLLPFDQVFVRSFPNFQEPKTVEVKGEITFPGQYPLIRRDWRVRDLVMEAGGLTNFAYPKGAKFYRPSKKVIKIDKYASSKYEDRNIVIDSLNHAAMGEMTVQNKLVDIDLTDVMKNPRSQYNYVLKPGDLLLIPTNDEIITIQGAIKNRVNDTTVAYSPYLGPKNAKWYINNYAAGFDENALRRTTQVVFPSGKAVATKKFLFFNVYPNVEPGTEIIVQYKPPKNENDKGFFGDLTAEKTLTLVGTIASTIALILAVR